jgi:hypothetical protein
MLINLSNHPLNKWQNTQLQSAKNLFSDVIDYPFPSIPPNADAQQVELMAFNTAKDIISLIADYPNQQNAVHIMGELNFTFAIVNILLKQNITCVASTTIRNVTELDNKKITEFSFVAFRHYKIPN